MKITNIFMNQEMDSFFEKVLTGKCTNKELEIFHDSLLSDSEFRETFCDWVKSLRNAGDFL